MLLPSFRKKKNLNIQIVDAAEWEEGEEEEEPDPEAMQQQVYEWAQEWSRTPAFDALTMEQKDEAEYITESFTTYMYDYHDVTPEHWNVGDMQECVLETLPRKISAKEIYYSSLAPVLASFFTFLGETNRLPDGFAMASRIRTLDKKIVAASNDPRRWGMAKTFAMAAIASGVDLTDDAQMQTFARTYNEQIIGQSPSVQPAYDEEEWDTDDSHQATTYVRESPKVGRNDPCPCGSGKKYKKCCGSA
jgi:hypothetical protein